MENKDSGTIYFLAGLLMGGLVGAGIGILVAPESGDKTLVKLRKQGEKVVKKSLDVMDEYKPRLEKAAKDLKPAVERVAKEFEPSVKKAVKQLQTKINTATGPSVK